MSRQLMSPQARQGSPTSHKSASWLLKHAYSQHLWQGHQRYIAGDLTGAAASYGSAGVLGAASLAVVYLALYDVPAAVALALRVAEFCFTPRWKKMPSGASSTYVTVGR